MTPDFVKRLVQQGETLDVGFRSDSTTESGDSGLVRTIVCLANRPGENTAWLLLGIGDDGTVHGARPHHDPDKLAAMVASGTSPRLEVRVHTVPIDGKTVLAIEIPVVPIPIASSDGALLRRVRGGDGKPACIPMDAPGTISLAASWGVTDPTSRLVTGASWDDLEPLEFDRFRRSVAERPRGDPMLARMGNIELARELGVVDVSGEARGIRLAALLLFGKPASLRRLAPNSEVAIQVFDGTKVRSNDFFRMPLLRITEEFETRIRVTNLEHELMVGFVRVGIPYFPPDVLREAFANAVTHRDYTSLMATHVQWHEDRIEISNPGGFPRGVTPENLLIAKPRARNPLLANAFKRAGVVDRTARGVDMMHEFQLKCGYRPPSYDLSDEGCVVVSLAVREPNLRFARLVAELIREGRDIGLNELLVFHGLCSKPHVTEEDAGRLIQREGRHALPVLEHLVECGLVTARGKGVQRRWIGTERAAAALGVPDPGAEPSDSDHTRLGQAVLTHVREHGSITRSEAAKLCRIGPRQATRLLAHLTRKDLLSQQGSKRGTRYEAGTEFAAVHARRNRWFASVI